MSDEAFAAALFSSVNDANSIEEKIKHMEGLFCVKVAKLHLGMDHIDNTMLCVNFCQTAEIETACLSEILSGSPVPTFSERAIAEAKNAMSEENSSEQDIVSCLMKHLKRASEPKRAWYILFSQNALAKSNASYAIIKNSPMLLSNMIGIDPDLFSARMLKKKKKKEKEPEFLM